MLALVGLLSVVVLGFSGFALGRRSGSASPIRWALAAAGTLHDACVAKHRTTCVPQGYRG